MPGARSYQPMNVNFGLFPPLAHADPSARAASGCAAREKTLAKKQALARPRARRSRALDRRRSITPPRRRNDGA